MDKNFNEFFEELNDMANFKNFGESKEEEIIIDGVNVEGCGFYHPEIDNYCHIALAFAEDYTDDNHTYLECEQNPNCYYKQLKRLEQENAELKAENERLKALCDTYKTCYQAKHSDVKCLLPKYRTTLQEIKEICKNSYTSASEAYYRTSDKILQKIIKAEEE